MPTKQRSSLSAYTDPQTPGALGGMDRYARVQGLTRKEALKELRQELASRRSSISHVARPGLPSGRAMGGTSSGNAAFEKMESRDTILSHRRRCLVQAHLGGTFEKQDGQSSDGSLPILFGYRRTKVRKFTRWLDQQGIRYFSTQGDAKDFVLERFNRTLKGRIYRYFTAKGTRDYLSVLPALVDGYNKSRHRNMAPKDVTSQNEKQVWQRLYGKRLRGRAHPRLKDKKSG